VIAGNRNPEIAREMYPGISGLHIALTWEWACLQTSDEINFGHIFFKNSNKKFIVVYVEVFQHSNRIKSKDVTRQSQVME